MTSADVDFRSTITVACTSVVSLLLSECKSYSSIWLRISLEFSLLFTSFLSLYTKAHARYFWVFAPSLAPALSRICSGSHILAKAFKLHLRILATRIICIQRNCQDTNLSKNSALFLLWAYSHFGLAPCFSRRVILPPNLHLHETILS